MGERSLKILMVDDSDLQLQYEQALLEGEDMVFVVAHNGEEAIECVRRQLPDLILMDIVMPTMDGIAAAQALRQDERSSTVPIIMVTSQREADYMESAFVGGCNDYVTKPVNKAELLAKIQSLTGYEPRSKPL